MTALVDFADSLAAVLETETGLTRLETLAMSETPIYPCGFFYAPEIDNGGLGNTTIELSSQIAVFVSAAIGGNHRDLLAYQDVSGDKSIAAALQRNRNLGFNDVDVYAVSSRPLNLVELSNSPAYGCVFTISAYLEGT